MRHVYYIAYERGFELINDKGMEYRVKNYLTDIHRRIRDIDAIRARIDDIEHQMSGLKGVQYRPDPASPNVNPDAIPDCIAELEEATRTLHEEVALHFQEINHAWGLCRPHESMNRHALWLHYVQGMSWGKVARAVAVSERTVKRMRLSGIRELYGAMPEQWRADYNRDHKAEI